MKKIKKIKIKINGKFSSIEYNLNLLKYLIKLRVPLKKVAIELNNKIVDKNKLKNVKLKKNDKIEIVHFIGGG
tara:strand:+ start:373 stop:591 length:219 start_codon:yes stop_codon:yes gene_type:complete